MDSLEEMFLGATGIGSLPKVGYQQVPMEAFLGTEKVDPYSVDQYIETLEADEGFIPVAKKLKKKNPETGKIEEEEFFTVGFGDYGAHVKKGETRTVEQDMPRFKQRVADRMNYIQREIPNFPDLSFRIRDSLVSSNYRGSIPGSPKTRELIRMGDLQGAGLEFLDNDEYRASLEDLDNRGGVVKRMERLSKALRGLPE
ncbi:MAG: hypothetical protein NWE78_05260 [Candidatus Bathyarchaeota archaeon]|nr:hypothetical protein [Candidatus Bathyarchaeota archaeon]